MSISIDNNQLLSNKVELESVEETYRLNNSKQIANIITNSSSSILKSSKGSSNYFKSIEEKERKRLLDNPAELNTRRIHGGDIARMVNTIDHPSFPRPSQGFRRYTSKLEENERQRRLSDQEESRARKVHALEISNSINIDASTIKARFIKRPRTQASILGSLKALSKQGRNTIAHVVDMINPQVASALERLPSLSSFLPSTTTSLPAITHVSISELEEVERQQRIAEDSSNYTRANAKRVANILAHTNIEAQLAVKFNGVRKVTRKIEEQERARRLANKSECEFHQMLSAATSSLIKQIGWPLIRSGVSLSSSIEIATEAERVRRLSDRNSIFTSRFNANRIAASINLALQHLQSRRLLAQQVRKLEEKERAYRIKNGALYAVHNAHREAQLIADIGGIFYKPTGSTEDCWFEEIANQVEDKERLLSRTVSDKQARASIKKVKNLVRLENLNDEMVSNVIMKERVVNGQTHNAGFVPLDCVALAERERSRRMKDKLHQEQAQSNATSVSRLIKRQSPYRSIQFIALPQPDRLPTAVLASPNLATTLSASVGSPSTLPLKQRTPKAKINVAARVPTPVASRKRAGVSAGAGSVDMVKESTVDVIEEPLVPVKLPSTPSETTEQWISGMPSL